VHVVACTTEDLFALERHRLIVFEAVCAVLLLFSSISVVVRRRKLERDYSESLSQRFH
jgi:hypothetical protein